MTDDEMRVLTVLGDAWDLFLGLPALHRDDKGEFLIALHTAQNIILARAGTRLLHRRTEDIIDEHIDEVKEE